MNARYSTDVEYGFTTLYTPNYGICHNICGTHIISFVVDRGSAVSKRHYNTGKCTKCVGIHLHTLIIAVHTSLRIKILPRVYPARMLEEGAPCGYPAACRAPRAPAGRHRIHPGRGRRGGDHTPAAHPPQRPRTRSGTSPHHPRPGPTPGRAGGWFRRVFYLGPPTTLHADH